MNEPGKNFPKLERKLIFIDRHKKSDIGKEKH